MASHSKYSASNSPRWLTCTGSIKAILLDQKSGRLPKEESSSDAAALGTAAHTLGEMCLGLHKKPKSFMGKRIGKFTVDENMVLAVDEYVNYILDKEKAYGVKPKLEQSASLRKIVGVDCGGTSDCAFVAVAYETLHVIDYKHGQGILVEATDNSQTRIYGLSIYHNLPKRIKRKIKTIVLTICQPRIFHEVGRIRSETLSITTILEWQRNTLHAAIKEAEGDAIILRASEKACVFCPRAPYCVENAALTLELAELEFADFSEESNLPAPKELGHGRILTILKHKDRMIKWLNSVHTHATDLQREKPQFEGFKLIESKANRAWEDAEVVQKKLKISKIKAYQKPVLKSPAQLQTILTVERGITIAAAKELIDELCEERLVTGTRLVADDTDGMAIINEPAHDFAEVISISKKGVKRRNFKLKR